MANVKVMGKVIKAPSVRLSFPDLLEAKAFEEGQEPKYGATLLVDPRKPAHRKLWEEIDAEEERMIAEAWGKAPLKLILEYRGEGNDRTSQQTGEIYEGYEGMRFIACKNKNQPLLLDPSKMEVGPGPTAAKLFYGGVYSNCTINLFIQDSKWGKAIRCSIRGVQSLGHGDPFGSRVSNKEFDDFDSDDTGVGAVEDDGLGDDDVAF